MNIAMNYEKVEEKDYRIFHKMMEEYYREGEDADTPQDVLDQFIQMLFRMIQEHKIEGSFVKKDRVTVGFVLWAMDTKEFLFSEMPGAGTILEMGVLPAFRRSGFGTQIVMDVEKQMCLKGMALCYVSAYGPAQKFWKRCGYTFLGTTADNGLPIMVKDMA